MAEYWTELPPKSELEQKLLAALLEARERLAWRGVLLGRWMMRDDMTVSKGLEFPVVALPSVGHMPAKGEDEQEEARLFYVAATRATHRLILTLSGASVGFAIKLEDRIDRSLIV